MLIRRVGDGFTGWDRAAAIEFEKPGEETRYAEFELPDAEVEEIQQSLDPGESMDREYHVGPVTDDGEVHAAVEQTLYVRGDE